MSVTVTSQDEASPKTILGIEVSQEPKKDYLVGDSLDLFEGRFVVAIAMTPWKNIPFTDEGIGNFWLRCSKDWSSNLEASLPRS